MLDRERLADYPGNPWKDEQFLLASHRVVEELEGVGALRLAQSGFDLVIVDECHRMQPGGTLFKRVSSLSRHAPHVLLLSATPSRQHARAYLALLSLLQQQPQVYRHDDTAGFAAKLAAHAEVTRRRSRARCAPWTASCPASRASGGSCWAPTPISRPPPTAARGRAVRARTREALVAHVREHHQLDARIIRHRRSFLRRHPRCAGAALAQAVRSVRAHRHRLQRRRARARPCAPPSMATGTCWWAPAAARRRRAWRTGSCRSSSPATRTWRCSSVRLLAMRRHRAHCRSRRGGLLPRARDPRGDTSPTSCAPTSPRRRRPWRTSPPARPATPDIAGEAARWWSSLREPRGGAALERARCVSLIQRLKRYWKDSPEEKVLIFTAQPLAVAPLAAMLQGAFGADAVTATFGAHQDADGREEAARRFRDDGKMLGDGVRPPGRRGPQLPVRLGGGAPRPASGRWPRSSSASAGVDRIGRDGDVPRLGARAPAATRARSSRRGPTCSSARWGYSPGLAPGLEFIADAIETTVLHGQAARGRGPRGLRAKHARAHRAGGRRARARRRARRRRCSPARGLGLRRGRRAGQNVIARAEAPCRTPPCSWLRAMEQRPARR